MACGFFLLARVGKGWATAWLALASLYFHGSWRLRYVALILASICFNYAAGYALSRLSEARAHHGRSRITLAAAVAANLLLLAYFKYADFFIGTVHEVTAANWPLLHIILPVGISFFTFTQIAFLVDASRGIAKEYNFVDYVLFVTYFPHLIAGPVLHHKQMMPQFADPKILRFSASSAGLGLTLFGLGLAKKVLLADTFSQYVGPVFSEADRGVVPAFTLAWEAALGYTLQIYFDFSAYSDMAVGLSLVFGIKLPINFYSPYKAWNIIDVMAPMAHDLVAVPSRPPLHPARRQPPRPLEALHQPDDHDVALACERRLQGRATGRKRDGQKEKRLSRSPSRTIVPTLYWVAAGALPAGACFGCMRASSSSLTISNTRTTFCTPLTLRARSEPRLASRSVTMPIR